MGRSRSRHPDLERTYSGANAGVGARYAWSGNRKAGKGQMEIIRADDAARVDIRVIFEKGLAQLKAVSES